MSVISTAPLRDPGESKLGSSSNEESLRQLKALFSQPQSGLFLINLPAGSGRTTRLNFLEHGIVHDQEVLEHIKRHQEKSFSMCVTRISCTNKSQEVDWRTYLVSRIHASAVSNNLTESLVSKIGTVRKLDSKGKFLANTIWPDVKKERAELHELVTLAPWKYGLTPDIMFSQLSKQNKSTQWVLLIDNLDLLQTKEKNDLCQEILEIREQFEYLVAFIAVDLYRDDDEVDIAISDDLDIVSSRHWRNILKLRGMELANIYGSSSVASENLFKKHLKDAEISINSKLANRIQEHFGTDLRAATRFVNRMMQFQPERIVGLDLKNMTVTRDGNHGDGQEHSGVRSVLQNIKNNLPTDIGKDIYDRNDSFNLAMQQKIVQFVGTTFLNEEEYRKTHYTRVAATLLLEDKCGRLIARIRKGDIWLLCSLLVWSLKCDKAPELFDIDDNSKRDINDYKRIRDEINEAIEILKLENGYIDPYYSIDQIKPYFMLDFAGALEFKHTHQSSNAAVLYWQAREKYEMYLKLIHYVFSPDSRLLQPSLLMYFPMLFNEAKQLIESAIETLGEYDEIYEIVRDVKMGEEMAFVEKAFYLTETELEKLIPDENMQFDEDTHFPIGDNPDYLQYVDNKYLKPRILANCVLLLGKLLLEENKTEENKILFNRFKTNMASVHDDNKKSRDQLEEKQKALQVRKANTELYTLFISYRYNPRDELLSDMLVTALRKVANETKIGELKVYLDRERLYAGGDWREALWRSLDNSHSYLLLCSPEYMVARPDIDGRDINNRPARVKADNWTWAEAAYARSASHRRDAPIFWVPVLSKTAEGQNVEDSWPETFRWLNKHQRGEFLFLPTNQEISDVVRQRKLQKKRSVAKSSEDLWAWIKKQSGRIKTVFESRSSRQSKLDSELTKQDYKNALTFLQYNDTGSSLYAQTEAHMEEIAKNILDTLIKNKYVDNNQDLVQGVKNKHTSTKSIATNKATAQ